VDINPDAFTSLKRNILLNRVQGNVIPLLDDARQIVHDRLVGAADRAIMNLPESAAEFVDVACEVVTPKGGVVHFYGFVRQPDTVEAMKNRFAEAVEKAGRRVERFLSARAVRETAPYEQQVVLDTRVI
jgi:tRNA (guanine37-N1)-methyltransferase